MPKDELIAGLIMTTTEIRTSGTVADEVCELCGAAGTCHRVIGEQDSFGTEHLFWCPDCLDKQRAEALASNELEIVRRVGALGGEQDIDFFVSALGNRDTVDECRIVRGTRSAVERLITWEDKAASRGDYLYDRSLRPATAEDRDAVAEWRSNREFELSGFGG